MPTIDEAQQIAIQHHAAGRLAEAEQIYREILRVHPEHPGALHLLGVIAHQVGAHATALEYIGRAIELEPNNAAYFSNLGEVYRAIKDHPRAIECFQRSIQLNPQQAEAYSNLGNVLDEVNRLDEARQMLEIAIRQKPDYPAALSNLGNVYKGLLQYQAAEQCYRRAIACDPGFVQAHNNLGSLLDALQRYAEAEVCFRETIRLNPRFAEGYYNLGGIMKRAGKYVDAAKLFHEAVTLKPEYAEAHNNLAVALKDLGHHHDAARHCRLALEHRANYIEAHNNLAVITEELGDLDEAINHYRQALAIKEDFPEVRSGYLLALNYHPDTTPEQLFQEHRRWGELHGGQAAEPVWKQSRDPDRRLRVGFISPDFRRHPVANFTEPVFTHFDPGQLEIVLYNDVEVSDRVTERIRSLPVRWVQALHRPDAEVAAQIRSDEIDILIDLAGHTSRNRLMTFVHRAAPIQISYLGYPNTTGLHDIDYVLTDAIVDPPDEERFFTERLYRIPQSFSCYRPRDDAAPLNDSPAMRNGYVTFGSLHSISKLNRAVLDLWARLLREVPDSRLLLFRTTFARETGDHFRAEFVRRGVAPERIDIRHEVPATGYQTMYHEIDITPDVFPWTGHTTACEAMWMGVPVVTKLGNRHAGRMVASVLHAVGHPEWIASDDDAWIETARRLASDRAALARLRSGLRDAMANSLLCDEVGFTRRFETALREIWRAGFVDRPAPR